MRLTLAIKTMFRSPLKTLLTFVLLSAASFMLIYSAADYVLTTREFQRAVAGYRGVGSVEYGPPARLTYLAGNNDFLLSDVRNPANSDEYFSYDDYHHKGLSQSDIDTINSLPYVTSLSPRYMTAGISTDLYRMDRIDSFFNYSARFVFEATLDSIDHNPPNSYPVSPELAKEHDIYISDIKLLAGDPDWLALPDSLTKDGQFRVRVHTSTLEYYKKYGATFDTAGASREVILYRQNIYYIEQLEKLIPGERYIFTGRVEPLNPWWENDWPSFYIGDDTLFDWWPYIYPLESQPENYLELDEFTPLRELIQVTNDDLHTFDVVYTDDMGTIRRILDEKILLTEGRLLTPEDSVNKNKVCVVSDTFMKEYGLELGDTVKLKLGNELFEQYAPLGAVASLEERYAGEFIEEEFKIVGTYFDINAEKMRDIDLYWAYSDNTIFIPLSYLPVNQSVIEQRELKPGELSFVIGDARNIKAFVEECIPKLEEMGLTVYFSDGGWLRIEEQVVQTKTLSLIKLLAFAAASFLAAALTVYLFIGRKRREYAIMRALGTTKRKAHLTLFVPLSLLAVLAVMLGSAAAVIYADRTAADSLKAFVEFGLEFDTSIPASIAVLGVFGELTLLLVLTSFGLNRIGKKPPLLLLRENTNRNINPHKKKVNTEAFASTTRTAEYAAIPVFAMRFPALEPLGTGKYSAARHVLRYIARHSRRALVKSLLALTLAALLFGAMGQFTAVRRSYSDLYHNISVKARFVNGLPFSRALKVADSGYVHSPYYEYIHKEGEVDFNPAELYMTSDITRVTGAPIEFLEGYDESSVMLLQERVCVLPSGLMETLGVELGDVVQLNELAFLETLRSENPGDSEEQLLEKYDSRSVDCKVVGCILGSSEQTAYVPVMAGDFFRSVLGGTLNLDLAEYILADYHKVEEFRVYAKEAVDSVRSSPPMFLMDTGEADNIYKIYKLIETLYPIAFIVAVLIGGMLPGLIILQSAKEASIMRVLGTTKKLTWAMLAMEQLMLCLFGLIIAFIILMIVNGNALLEVAGALLPYCLLHLAGCVAGTAVCAVVNTRRKVLELLQVKE